MAARNPSKQRRQARNRAAREAREARAKAANTPAEERRPVAEEEPEPKRRTRRRRARASRTDVREKAREVIDATASDDDEIDSDSDDSGSDDSGSDDSGPSGDERESVVAAAPGRATSPVFSARHRSQIAAITADRAPARTHVGVAEATGVETVAPRSAVKQTRRPKQSGSSARSGSATATRSETSNGRSADRSTSRSSSQRSNPSARTTKPSGATSRGSGRPPPRPLPPFLDRFGGNEPGGRWVMMSFAMVLMASIIINFVHIVPEIVEVDGEQVQTGEYFTIWHYGIGPGLYFLLPPIIIFALFILTARPWDRRRSWNIALASLVFITFVTQSISIYIVPLGALAWGCWKARKAALDEVGGDPRVLREVERERRIEGKEALRAARGSRSRRDDS